MKEQLTINSGQNLLGPKTPVLGKKCFSWRLGNFFRWFEWKYCAVSENVFYMSVIYLHFSYCKFSFFRWFDWVRFKTRLPKGPFLELVYLTGFLTKFLEFDLGKWKFRDGANTQTQKQIHKHGVFPSLIANLTFPVDEWH